MNARKKKEIDQYIYGKKSDKISKGRGKHWVKI